MQQTNSNFNKGKFKVRIFFNNIFLIIKERDFQNRIST